MRRRALPGNIGGIVATDLEGHDWASRSECGSAGFSGSKPLLTFGGLDRED